MKLKKTTKRTAVLIAIILLAIGIAAVAPAAALKVDGARIALDVTPGQTAISPIGVSIGADEKEGDFAVEVLGFGQSEDGIYTGLAASADTLPFTARPYITVDKPSVHLKPGERAAVTATIAVPVGTADGGRYAIILVHPGSSSSGAPAAFATAVAIPVFLTVKGGAVDRKGEITSVETSTVEVGKPFTVTAALKNAGNYHYYGIVTNVTVADSSGAAVASKKTTPMIRAIIPGNVVKSAVPVVQGLPEGMYRLTVRMETQDGDVLDSETKSLQVGIPVTPVSTGKNPIPGPGVLAICMAAAIGILAGERLRRKRE